MSLLITCPVPSTLTTVPVPTCIQDFGQVTKAVFQRRYSSGTTENLFTIASANPNVVASWDTFFDATDATATEITPYLNNSAIEGADAVTFGGGDATAFGISRVIAQNPSSFTAEIHATRQDVISALKTYQGEILAVYLINEHGQIAGKGNSVTSPTTFQGFPIVPGTFFVSDLKGGKRESPDMNVIQFQFYPNWSDLFYVVVPSDFNGNDLS